jgi:SAM-dependent methyltransferase
MNDPKIEPADRDAPPRPEAGGSPDPTARFSNRVENYEKFRPRYPAWIVELAREKLGLPAGAPVADIGSGTGLSSAPFLEAGHPVFAVEPNTAMRACAEAKYRDNGLFRAVDARAEATGLADGSVSMYLSGQAFHWFEPAAARAEALRVTDARHRALLVWNERDGATPGFGADYEALMNEFATDYQSLGHNTVTDERLDAFFGGSGWTVERRSNAQAVDWEGLRGRVLSASYFPTEDTAQGQAGLMALRNIFEAHARGGRVALPYATACYWGTLGG